MFLMSGLVLIASFMFLGLCTKRQAKDNKTPQITKQSGVKGVQQAAENGPQSNMMPIGNVNMRSTDTDLLNSRGISLFGAGVDEKEKQKKKTRTENEETDLRSLDEKQAAKKKRKAGESKRTNEQQLPPKSMAPKPVQSMFAEPQPIQARIVQRPTGTEKPKPLKTQSKEKLAATTVKPTQQEETKEKTMKVEAATQQTKIEGPTMQNDKTQCSDSKLNVESSNTTNVLQSEDKTQIELNSVASVKSGVKDRKKAEKDEKAVDKSLFVQQTQIDPTKMSAGQ
ncbi:hypothetical protein M3Y95_00144800 [Aphelenchoides besseyi]|nr:hypothetical protein M3Y95_00144800 [Aphelenchoides besseyi]